MKLYHFPASPNARRVLAVLAHLEMEVEHQIVDISKGHSRRPEYLEVNPNGRIPTLVDGDFVLWESNAIIQYLCDIARADGNQAADQLLPADPRGRADVLRWQAWQIGHLSPGAAILTYENLVKRAFMGQDPDPAEVERGHRLFAPNARLLDGHLAGRAFVCGDAVTIADYSLAAVLMYADMAGISLAEYPNVAAWYARVDALPAWRASAPQLG